MGDGTIVDLSTGFTKILSIFLVFGINVAMCPHPLALTMAHHITPPYTVPYHSLLYHNILYHITPNHVL